ncbi:hypothetical protein [Tolypothrix sp. NIES-4075]|nr:hypothetical protein [Tolypothrix sp. NIES-4075]
MLSHILLHLNSDRITQGKHQVYAIAYNSTTFMTQKLNAHTTVT